MEKINLMNPQHPSFVSYNVQNHTKPQSNAVIKPTYKLTALKKKK